MARPKIHKPGTRAYRPDYSVSDPTRPHLHEVDSYRPGEQRRADSYRPSRRDRGDRDNRARADITSLPPLRSAVSKTKHERKSNPSTRIHSLKRQLQTEHLPGMVRQERERELAALLFEQQKTAAAQDERRNLSRYHFVRFIERKKAERTFKQLHQRKSSPNFQSEDQQSELNKLIHIADVDVNYTKFAPLGDKYISLYPMELEKSKAMKKKKNGMQINGMDFAAMDEKQQEELRKVFDLHANIIRSAEGAKPPMWYEVEKAMEQGQEKLEALRDGKLTTGLQLKSDLATVGGKEEAALRAAKGQPLEGATPNWLNDDGMIDPEDLDSDQDEDMPDGGFFER